MRKLALVSTVLMAGLIGSTSRSAPVQAASVSSVSGMTIVQTAMKYLGAAYRAKGTDPETGFSDLGFVRYVYAQSGVTLHIGVTKSAYKHLLAQGAQVDMADLRPGDIVFFKNVLFAGISHVGIYVGGGKFVHAEWYDKGVTVTSLQADPSDGNYWATHYQTANRPWSGT